MHISNDKSRYTDKMHEIHHLVRNDMDVNEHERLSNITHSSKETALSLLFCISVTIGSSIMGIVHTIKHECETVPSL